MPNLYIIAGPNGAGKTTAAYTLLPEVMQINEFVNADEIARGISPFNVDGVAFEAGRLMLQRIDYLMEKGEDFAFETTLATRSYVQLIKRAQRQGYVVSLYYFWLPSAVVSKERVAFRVARGGHNIPADVIERRYSRSILNLRNLYVSVCDYFTVIDNGTVTPQLVAVGKLQSEVEVYNEQVWKRILAYGNDEAQTNPD
ncbi:zeta toxin family protein [Fibrella sp. WM1]|uniref:zeta toxin family protein n=1 Tax=Fibrella musci TaxID=3242485 RepID=UPI003520F991